jgi:hypothetical protein
MHVSWTTLREQIFAKLRRPYRSEANMNEVGHGKNTNNAKSEVRFKQLMRDLNPWCVHN